MAWYAMRTSRAPTTATNRLQMLKPVTPIDPSALNTKPPTTAPTTPRTMSTTAPSPWRFTRLLARKPETSPRTIHATIDMSDPGARSEPGARQPQVGDRPEKSAGEARGRCPKRGAFADVVAEMSADAIAGVRRRDVAVVGRFPPFVTAARPRASSRAPHPSRSRRAPRASDRFWHIAGAAIRATPDCRRWAGR